MRSLRRHLVGLPLQRSTFSNLARAPVWLGLEQPPSEVAALIAGGELLVDDAILGALGPQMAGLPTAALSVATQRVRAATAAAANAATRTAPRSAPVQRLVAIGEALRTFVPLPILGKSIAPSLYGALLARGFDGTLPAPSPSPGARLTHDLLELADACSSHGLSASAVRRDWPEVPPAIARLVRDFAQDHSGFGPLAWEAPGLEDPGKVVAQLASIASSVRPPPALQTNPTVPESAGAHLRMLHEALEAWLSATENGLQIVRAAFHSGIKPLLGACGRRLGLPPSDLLFASFDEFPNALPGQNELRERRRAYGAAQDYLAAHGIDATAPDRLAVAE